MREMIFQTEGRVQCNSIRLTLHFSEFIYGERKRKEGKKGGKERIRGK